VVSSQGGVVTETKATGYDGLLSRLVPEIELRTFLRECFEISEYELFVSHEDRVVEGLRGVPEEVVFAAFCTYRHVFGHFAMSFSVGITGRLADRLGRREFTQRLAARFDAYVLDGATEPPWLWTMILADGTRLLAEMDGEDDRFLLYAVTAPVPALPEVRVDEDLGKPW
jgi:hypothetical protein